MRANIVAGFAAAAFALCGCSGHPLSQVWTSDDGVVTLSMPDDWERSPGEFQPGAQQGIDLLLNAGRESRDPKKAEIVVCAVMRHPMASSPESFVEREVAAMEASNAQFGSFDRFQPIASNRRVDGVPVLDYEHHISSTPIGGRDMFNTYREFALNAGGQAHVYVIMCAGNKDHTTETRTEIAAFMNSLRITRPTTVQSEIR